MTWYKVDDGIHSHPKFLDVSLAAVGLWTMCGAWCSAYLTDGQITRRQVLRLGGDDALAAELDRLKDELANLPPESTEPATAPAGAIPSPRTPTRPRARSWRWSSTGQRWTARPRASRSGSW